MPLSLIHRRTLDWWVCGLSGASWTVVSSAAVDCKIGTCIRLNSLLFHFHLKNNNKTFCFVMGMILNFIVCKPPNISSIFDFLLIDVKKAVFCTSTSMMSYHMQTLCVFVAETSRTVLAINFIHTMLVRRMCVSIPSTCEEICAAEARKVLAMFAHKVRFQSWFVFKRDVAYSAALCRQLVSQHRLTHTPTISLR